MRNNPKKLERIPFEGTLEMKEDIVMEVTTDELFCEGDWGISIGNLLNLYKVIGGNVFTNENLTCDPNGDHMFLQINKGNRSEIVKTDIQLRAFSEEEINKYLAEDSYFNTYALGYDPYKHYSSTFAKRIEGSYYNFLQGLPLETIIEMLSKIGYKYNF